MTTSEQESAEGLQRLCAVISCVQVSGTKRTLNNIWDLLKAYLDIAFSHLQHVSLGVNPCPHDFPHLFRSAGPLRARLSK